MRSRRARAVATVVAAVVGLVLAVGVTSVRFGRVDVGYVGVVRNGGPFDDRGIRQVLMPGEEFAWLGLFSQGPHQYPASNNTRTYVVTSDPRLARRPGVGTVTVPTKDGVQVGVEGTVFLRFVGERDLEALERFETAFGDRRFRTPDGRMLHPWEGDDGFAAWLDTYFRPILVHAVQRELGQLDCAELVASCSLVTRGAVRGMVEEADAEAIGKRVSKAIQGDVARTLGQPYLWGVSTRIARVVLPADLQTEIDETQAQFAAVNRARAEFRQTQYRAASYRLLGRAFNRSPGLVRVETMRALPSGTTVLSTANGRVPWFLAGQPWFLGGTGGTGGTPTPAPPSEPEEQSQGDGTPPSSDSQDKE